MEFCEGEEDGRQMLTRNAGQSVDDQGNFGEHGPEFLQGGEMNLRFHGYERHG